MQSLHPLPQKIIAPLPRKHWRFVSNYLMRSLYSQGRIGSAGTIFQEVYASSTKLQFLVQIGGMFGKWKDPVGLAILLAQSILQSGQHKKCINYAMLCDMTRELCAIIFCLHTQFEKPRSTKEEKNPSCDPYLMKKNW